MKVATIASLCLELFVLAQKENSDVNGAARGRMWEMAVAAMLADRGIAIESVPGGYRVLGFLSLSQLMHQVDATLSCTDAIILAEWKAYSGAFPKNELLRFKAATDDFYMSFGTVGRSHPVVRLFGGIGTASNELRQYAALHGIVLMEIDRWPLPVLASNEVIWPGALTACPSVHEQKALSWGARPMQRVMRPQASGGFLVPRPKSAARIESLLRLHEYWSDRLWEAVDLELGSPNEMLSQLGARPRAA